MNLFEVGNVTEFHAELYSIIKNYQIKPIDKS
jgi:hypothetical protein